MNQHETAEPVRTEKPDLRSFLVAEAPAIAGMVSALIAYAFEDVLFADLNNYPLTILLFIWLFGTMMWCAFGAVRHADAVAVRPGEPYGTLVLTLSVTRSRCSPPSCCMARTTRRSPATPCSPP
jgi:hypothetical protein